MKGSLKSILFILLLCILILNGCMNTALSAGGGTTITENDGPPAAVLEAQAWLGMHLGASVEEIRIVSMEQVEWTDSCFGLGGAAEICAAEITPGWRAYFEINGLQYEVRFNETGTIARSPQL